MGQGVRSNQITQASVIDELLGNVTQDGIVGTVRISTAALGQQIAEGAGAIVAKQIKSTFEQLDAIKGTMAEGDIGLAMFDDDEAKRGQYAKEGGVLVRKGDLSELQVQKLRDETSVLKNDAETASQTAQSIRVATQGLKDDTSALLVQTSVIKDEAADRAIAARQAAEASGPVRFFDTFALAQAGLAALPNGQLIEVHNDETRGFQRSRFAKEGGQLQFKTGAGMDVEDQFTTSFGQPSAVKIRSVLEQSLKYNGGHIPQWADPLCLLDADWVGNRYWIAGPWREFRAFSRMADYGGPTAIQRATAASYLSSAGVRSIVAAGALRRGDAGLLLERASANLLTNPTFSGAAVGVIGAGGVFPTGYEPNFTVTREIVATGTENGRRTTTFRLARTGGTPSTANVNIRTASAGKFAVGGPSVFSGTLQVLSMSGAATGVRPSVSEFTAADASVGATNGDLAVPASGAVDFTVWRNTAFGNRVQVAWNAVLASATGDFEVVFKVYDPQLEEAASASDKTSFMAAIDGTSPRATEALSLLFPNGNYEVLIRGVQDTWLQNVAVTDEKLDLSALSGPRTIKGHRVYPSGMLTLTQKQAVIDERPSVFAVTAGNQLVGADTWYVQNAANPWSLLRASNRRAEFEFETRPGDFWSSQTDRLRSELQCSVKDPFNTDIWFYQVVTVWAPLGVLCHTNVVTQWHQTEDAGDFSGYPPFAILLTPTGLAVEITNVPQASWSTPYERAFLAENVPFTLGVPHAIVGQLRFAPTSNTGLIKVWLDGKIIADFSGPVGINDAVGPYAKVGLYNSPHDTGQIMRMRWGAWERSYASLADRISQPIPSV